MVCLILVGKDMELDAVGHQFEPYSYSRMCLHWWSPCVWHRMLFQNIKAAANLSLWNSGIPVTDSGSLLVSCLPDGILAARLAASCCPLVSANSLSIRALSPWLADETLLQVVKWHTCHEAWTKQFSAPCVCKWSQDPQLPIAWTWTGHLCRVSSGPVPLGLLGGQVDVVRPPRRVVLLLPPCGGKGNGDCARIASMPTTCLLGKEDHEQKLAGERLSG